MVLLLEVCTSFANCPRFIPCTDLMLNPWSSRSLMFFSYLAINLSTRPGYWDVTVTFLSVSLAFFTLLALSSTGMPSTNKSPVPAPAPIPAMPLLNTARANSPGPTPCAITSFKSSTSSVIAGSFPYPENTSLILWIPPVVNNFLFTILSAFHSLKSFSLPAVSKSTVDTILAIFCTKSRILISSP